MQFFLFLALFLSLALVVFALQNSEVIIVNFINWAFESSLALLLVLTFAAGMLAGVFSSIPAFWRKAKTNRIQKRRIQELEREVLDFSEKMARSEGEEIGVEEEY